MLLCDTYLTRRITKVKTGKTNSSNEVEIENKRHMSLCKKWINGVTRRCSLNIYEKYKKVFFVRSMVERKERDR